MHTIFCSDLGIISDESVLRLETLVGQPSLDQTDFSNPYFSLPQMSYWYGLPTFLFGVTSILSGFLTLLMPETANTELPDTVDEAERIGRTSKSQPLLLTEQENKPDKIT